MTGSVARSSVHHSRAFFPALLLAAGIILLQALIGGRVLLFAFPGLSLIACAALFGTAFSAERKASANLACLISTAIFGAYIIVRAGLTPGYFARADLFSILGALVVYGITATVITSSRARLAIVLALLGFALIHVVVGAMQFSRGDNFMPIPFLQRVDYGQRASGFYVCPNHLAGMLEVVGVFGLAISCWGRLPVWAKLLTAYATGMCYLGVALTASRGGYVSTLASLLFFAAVSFARLRAAQPGTWRKFAILGGAILACVVIAGAVLIQESSFLKERAGNVIDRKNVRMTLWRAAVTQWELQPFVGTGAGTYRFYGRQFRSEEMQRDPVDVHNDYLHLLCEYGVLGAGAFLAFFAAHARQSWKTISRSSAQPSFLLSNRTAMVLGASSAVVAFVVHSALDFNLHIPANAILLAFVFGIIANPATSGRPAKEDRFRLLLPRFVTAALAGILLVQSIRLVTGEYFTERARMALRDEQPESSTVYASKALEHERKNPQLFFYWGRALLALGHNCNQPERRLTYYKDAVRAFTTATSLAPLDGTYLLNLAFTYDEMGLFSEAEQFYEQAKIRDPRSSAVAQLYQAHLEQRSKIAESGERAM